MAKSEGKLSGKTTLVTGGSRGIGRAIAAEFVRMGAVVFICARNRTALEKTVREIEAAGGRIHGIVGDVGNADDAARMVKATAQHTGSVDVLVSNASLLGPRLPIVDYPLETWEEVLRANLTGPFLLAREVLRLMIPRRQGSIINVSSGVGRVGRARWGAYTVSKFGLEGLTQMLAEEVKEFGIRVNAVNPGPTRTEMRAAAYPDEDPRTLVTPDKIAPIFVYLASDDSKDVTGQSLEAQGWSAPVG
jgi:NAD(P)-dependent dehydrogenase (short-subunit alcohol dehydrogenase family)